MKKLILALLVIPLLINTVQAGDWDVYTGAAPWGGQIFIEISPIVASRFDIDAYSHMNAIGTRVIVKFISKKVYSRQDAAADDIIKRLQRNGHHPSTVEAHIRSAIVDTTGQKHSADKFLQFIHATQPIEMSGYKWKPVSKGTFAIANRQIKTLKIWWDGSGK